MSPKTCDEVRYISRYFYNMGIEGWNIVGWRESQNNIDIWESQNSSKIWARFDKREMHHLPSAEPELEKRGGGGVHSDHVSVGGAELAPWGTRRYGPASRAINLEPLSATA